MRWTGPAVHDEGQAEAGQKVDPGVLDLGTMQDDTIGGPLVGKIPISIGLAVIVDNGQGYVIAVLGKHLARADHEIGVDRVDDFGAAGERDDLCHGHGAAGGEVFGAVVGFVVVEFRGFYHALTRAFVDLAVTAKGAADRGGRKVEDLGKFLEVHYCADFQNDLEDFLA